MSIDVKATRSSKVVSGAKREDLERRAQVGPWARSGRGRIVAAAIDRALIDRDEEADR